MDAKEPRPKKGTPCPKCGNLLRLRPDQLGEQVKCPKCNTAFTVGRPEEPRSATVSADDLYEPEIPLRKSTIVPEEPVKIVHEDAPQMRVAEPGENEAGDLATSAPLAQDVAYEVDWSSAEGELEMEQPHVRPVSVEPEYLELADSRGLVRNKENPYQPQWIFLSTVFEFPWMGQNAWRWTMVAFGLAVSGALFVPIVELMKRGPDLMMVLLALVASGVLLLTGGATSAVFLAAIQDTSDGFREVQESTFPEVGEWFFSFLSLLYIWGLSGAIGYPLVFVDAIGPVAVPISMFVMFPILVLSGMECESFLFPYSPAILRTLGRVWWAWLGFYGLSAALCGGWFAAVAYGYPRAPYLTSIGGALALAALVLIYARLLGRIAWKAGFVLEPGEELGRGTSAETTSSGNRKRSRKGRRGRRRIDFPPELDQAARFVDPPPVKPPRR